MKLDPLLANPEFRLHESPAIDNDSILKVHTPELIEDVKQDGLCSTAWHSVGVVVLAAETIAKGEVENAFAFIGAGGHHAGLDFFGGYCCFNDVVIAIEVLRSKNLMRRFAILDSDAHHGDGTRDLIKNDPEVLHVCMCGSNICSPDGTKVDVASPHARWHLPGSYTPPDVDMEYATAAIDAFVPRA